ncbi:hypothetical protein FTO74_14110 [Granulicella sp. WH15]|uniref:hypothetical protein n=1 Tax=Granulicella sp. WH15 TaxID=2602070 RepID=UPI0013672F6C|nr:hypothetical protein [Granulicella sp. WH15]QHN04366.1 hypothetical protein FTO74_14110 [Granulicella sp. WH15]
MTNAEDSHDTNPALGTEMKSPSALASTSQPDDLHDLFAAPADDAEDPLAGLRNDPNYAALIRDLEYIAREARELFNMAEEPSDSVWANIQKELEKGEAE